MSAGAVIYRSIKGNRKYDPHVDQFLTQASVFKNVMAVDMFHSQLTTGSAVEIAEKTGTAISNIGKTELTLVGAMSANDNDYDGDYLYVTYKDVNGDTYAARMTINTTDSTTEVAFYKYDVDGTVTATAVTDCYCITAFSCSQAVKAGHTAGCGATGALTTAVIQAEASAAVEADLHGVGTVYGRYHTDHANYEDAVSYIEYSTPWGEVKYAAVTANDNAVTEELYYEGTLSTNRKTVTAGSTSIKDFYRLRWLYCSATPESGHTYLLTDADCGNVDGSGNDVWAMIEESNYYSVHSRYHCPLQHNAVMHLLELRGPSSATNYAIVAVTYTPKGHNKETTINFTMSGVDIVEEADIAIEPGTDISMTIIDGAHLPSD